MWASWESGTLWGGVERVQLEAARLVGGTLRNAPREAVLAEAGLCELKKVAETLWMCELEKCLRTPTRDPQRESTITRTSSSYKSPLRPELNHFAAINVRRR